MSTAMETSVTPSPTPSPLSHTSPALGRSPSVRWAGDDDHLVLLDLASSEYFMLNAAGSRVWELLNPPVEPRRIAAAMAAESSAPAEQVQAEVDDLLKFLGREGLVVENAEAATDQAPRPATGTPRPTRPDLESRRPPSRYRVAIAWAVLAWSELLASRAGLAALLSMLPECPTPTEPTDPDEVAATLTAVDRAADVHLRQIWCLPRSAAATWLLRRRGVPARLVIGVRPVPFFAHAWVEVDGHAAGEGDEVCSLHVLERF